MFNPKVSIVIPAYNSEKYIKETIDSVLNQTFDSFELLIIDDCSTDSTAQIINTYIDERIKYYKNEENKGISFTRNIGLELAKSEYIMFLDHDDLIPEYRLEKQINFLKDNADTALYGGAWKFIGNGDSIVKVPLENNEIKVFSIFHSPFGSSCVMIRKKMLEKYNLNYNNRYPCAEDYDLWIQMLKHFKGANSDEIFLYYRIHDSQASVKRSEILRLSDRNIKNNILNNILSYKVTEDELDLHCEMAISYNLGEDITKITKGFDWLEKIYQANLEKQIYNNQALMNFFEKIAYFIAYNGHLSGLKIFFEYKKSRFKNKQGLKQLFTACFRADRKKLKRKICRLIGINKQSA